ncbi:DUF2750 domain-containing protein [Salinispirillum marinum]|uniref:DUF2750 domain-containing protein n=2 Tax=Saccharospirillaceae TaxID=255527 RepID=A0ABV8BCD7_9GAMM
MTMAITEHERLALATATAQTRFDHCLSQAISSATVWTLRGDDGGVLMSSEGHSCVPIWPDAEFAAEYAEEDWADCAPYAIPLNAWMDRWLPGLQKDGLRVVVFPDAAEEGIVIAPKDLKKSLQALQQE